MAALPPSITVDFSIAKPSGQTSHGKTMFTALVNMVGNSFQS
jgi:hypothetical protein